MKLSEVFFKIIVLSTALFWSCTSTSFDAEERTQDEFQFLSNVTDFDGKVLNTSWSTSDAIGLYAIKAGEPLSSASVYSEYDNVLYTAVNNTGSFTSTSPIQLDGIKAVDIIAYAPYRADITDHVYPIDLTKQTDRKRIDVLYSNNVKNINNIAKPRLQFKHQLSRLVFEISKGEGIASMTDFDAQQLSGTIASANLKLATGELSLGTLSEDIKGISPLSVSNDKVEVAVLVVPNQKLDVASFQFTVDGKKFIWKEHKSLGVLKSGAQYTIKLAVEDKKGEPEVVHLAITSTIKDWNQGYEDSDYTELKPSDENVLEGVESLLFLETYDKANKVVKGADNKFPKVSEFKGFDNKHIQFSSLSDDVDIRSTKSYPNFVWFPSNRDCHFHLEGFGLNDYKKIKMQVKVTIDITKKKGNFDLKNLQLFFDNVQFEVPTRVLTSEDTNDNKFYALEYDNLPTQFNSLTFKIEAKENHGIRLGNISIFGTR